MLFENYLTTALNRLQEIHLEEMRVGRTGNEILKSILDRGRAEGLRPRVYTHPIGPYGHGSGTMIGMPEKQEFVPGTGEHPLHGARDSRVEWIVAKRIDAHSWLRTRGCSHHRRDVHFLGISLAARKLLRTDYGTQ